MAYTRKDGDRYFAAHGETFVCVVEFASTQKAQCAVSYGNASQPGSPHLADQLELMSGRSCIRYGASAGMWKRTWSL